MDTRYHRCGATRQTGLSPHCRNPDPLELTVCGTFLPFGFRTSLVQHRLELAAWLSPRCSSRRQCGHSVWANDVKYKPHFRCTVSELSRRGTEPPFGVFDECPVTVREQWFTLHCGSKNDHSFDACFRSETACSSIGTCAEQSPGDVAVSQTAQSQTLNWFNLQEILCSQQKKNNLDNRPEVVLSHQFRSLLRRRKSTAITTATKVNMI